MTPACIFGLSAAIGLTVHDGVDVVLRNRLTTDQQPITACILDVDGVRVGIIWHHMPGDQPDIIEITPPPGWTVDKPTAVVPENNETVARVRQMEMM